MAANENKTTAWNKFTMDAGRVLLSPLILFFRVKKLYVPGKISKEQLRSLKGALIAANHVGFSDPFILNATFWYRRFFYTASEEVMEGIRGTLLKAAGCIKIDRTAADIRAVKRCAEVLKEGYLLGMFPQGHIGGDALKGGVMLIAAMAKVPVVPAFIIKRKHFWQRHRVVFGEPIVISEYTDRTLPGKKDMESLLKIFDERCKECQTVGER